MPMTKHFSVPKKTLRRFFVKTAVLTTHSINLYSSGAQTLKCRLPVDLKNAPYLYP